MTIPDGREPLSQTPLALDIACVLGRLEQINREDEPTHWLWDRVMTCDVPRLTKHLAQLDAGADVCDVPGSVCDHYAPCRLAT